MALYLQRPAQIFIEITEFIDSKIMIEPMKVNLLYTKLVTSRLHIGSTKLNVYGFVFNYILEGANMVDRRWAFVVLGDSNCIVTLQAGNTLGQASQKL